MSQSLNARLRQLTERMSRDSKMRLELLSRSGECILAAGAASSASVHQVRLADSQLAFARWFGAQMAEAVPHGRAFMIDDRRGGKTWAGLLALVALTVESRSQSSYVVSHPGQRDAEISEFFSRFVPALWFDKTDGTNPEYAFARSSITNISTKRLADVPSHGACLMVNDYTMLKERDFDALMEFQGMVIVAGPPPSETKERWIQKYKERIKTGEFHAFRVPPRDNHFIHQPALNAVNRLVEVMSPARSAALSEFWADLASSA